MSNGLRTLMDAGLLAPLSYYFARFVVRGCGVDEDSVLGRSAALVSARNLDGDVCVNLGSFAGMPLVEEVGEEPIAVPRLPPLRDWLAVLQAADWVGEPGGVAPLILDGQRLYLGKYWHFEDRVARALRARMEPVREVDEVRLAQGLGDLFQRGAGAAGELDWQRIAAAIAAGHRFAVISGGPGTGKTTTVVKVLVLLLAQDPALRIALAAPTGKAAARLTAAVRGGKARVGGDAGLLSAIPEEARTIHRLLGVALDGVFRHDRDNPLPLDCLLVDEASMVDLPLMARLLEALPERARLVLLGDRDQLASVEAGNVLGDITGHGREILYAREQIDFLERVGAAPGGALAPAGGASGPGDAVGLLRVSYRFGAESGIAALSGQVNAGNGEEALRLLGSGRCDDIAWLDARETGLNPACIEWAVERYSRYLRVDDVVTALGCFEQIRVLAALRRGPFGVEEINRAIEARLHALGLIQAGEEYHGKPVMVTTNDYELGLFNGDIGLLWRSGHDELRVCFPCAEGQVRSVSVRQLPEHCHAYALTVHKSQGSEFDEILLVLPFDSSPAVTRELIYTGATRARQKLVVQASRATFLAGCKRRVGRSSGLAERLGWDAEREGEP